MAAITWDAEGKKIYEAGDDHGVLYLKDDQGAYTTAVPWNGLTAVTESPSGADEQTFYADNIKYGSLRGTEDFGFSIECYTYPDEWGQCDGSLIALPGMVVGQQKRKSFGFSYRSTVGNDVEGMEYGYKLHLIYNATASPSERSYSTINDSPEAITFSYECTTTPVAFTKVADARPVSLITVDSKTIGATKMKALEDVLYGTDSASPKLPTPDEVYEILSAT